MLPRTVAIVTLGYPPRLGGIEVVVGHIATELVRPSELGCRVDVLAQHIQAAPNHPGERRHSRRSLTVRWFRSQTRFRSDFHLGSLPLDTPAPPRRLDYDVIYGHGFHAWPAFAAARATDRPFVFNPHYHRIGHTPMARVDPPGRAADRLDHRRAEPPPCSAARRPRSGNSCGLTIRSVASGCVWSCTEWTQDEISGGRAAAIVARPVLLVAGRLEPYKQVRLAIEALLLDRPRGGPRCRARGRLGSAPPCAGPGRAPPA